MDTVDKKGLTEWDICTKYITPALVQAGWDLHSQIREPVRLSSFFDNAIQSRVGTWADTVTVLYK
jgi:type I site-specific restriction endonuclease